MAEGMRERKKQRTRRELVEAAIRLFDRQGYEQTTVAQIAAAADVGTRTFFGYFPSKEDVLFADAAAFTEAALAAVADRRPGEHYSELLVRVVRQALAFDASAVGLAGELPAVRVRLVLSVPALQARALRQLFAIQARLAEALHRAYPAELDEYAAAAAVGALVGAVVSAGLAVRSADPDADHAEIERVVGIGLATALAGIGPDRRPAG
ncbi:TetR family transcriptional regulator [Allonocardiopsis opalescens]|uniref:TetR family transcriptional regulator n=1 Tax=Allonocardiopsis opalescens TaxID=1144618 RepID=A0A2T0QCS7_9ACTN|nr:TetR family transcriptional regulator [Allonocardiopsis opalescens]PRY01670.1 TetR family transcriptional regulator [Allonocardiopsis opalescens]